MSSNLKILVADDNRDHVELISQVLKQELKAEIEGVTTGEECLRKVSKTRYDLLLLDYLFPKISGLDILKKIAKKGYDLPVIMITGHGNEKVAVETMKAGAIDYIVKSEHGFDALPSVVKKSIEKSQLRKRLTESEEKFKNLFESANDGIIHLDRAGRILEVNTQAVEIFGGSKEEVLGRHFTRLGIFTPGDIPTLMSNFANILAGGETTFNVCIKNKKGQEIPLECSASLMKIDDKATGVMVVARDITERKQVEEALRDSEERYRAIFRQAADSIVLIDAGTGALVEFNDRAHESLVYTRKEFEKLKIPDFEGIESPKEVVKHIEKIIKEGADTFETKHRTKSGDIRDILVSSRAISIRGKDFIQSIWSDITERKIADGVLRQAAKDLKELEYIVNHAPAIAFLWRAAEGWPVDFVSDNVKQFGYTPEDFYTGRLPFANIVHPDDLERVAAEVDKYSQEEGRIEFTQEYRIVTKSGEVRWLDDRTWIRRYPDGIITHYQGIVLDITKRKRVEEALMASLKEKEVLLREIHHRVKNNMQLVSSLINLQTDYMQNKADIQILKAFRDRIRSMRLIHEKFYSSADLTHLDFNVYVRDLLEALFRAYAVDKTRIAFQVDVKDSSFGIDTAIPLGLIINELISNSLKHAFPEGKEGELKITLYLRGKGKLELVVSDNGVGIPKDLDFRNTKSLGLRLVTILVEDQLHGNIELDRTEGTKFMIRVKVK